MGKIAGLVVVARGDGWALAWPRERWERLTAAQQQDVIATQMALLSQNVPSDRTRRRTPRAALAAATTGHQG